MYHIDWFAYIESLHPWNKPNFITVYELFDVLLNCLLKFCWGFLYLCSSVILACDFLFLWYLCLVLVSGWWWPHGMSLGVFLPSFCNFLKEFEKDGCYLISKCLIEFSCEAIWSWAFVFWEIFDHSFNFSACNWVVHNFYFFLVQSWKIEAF